MVQLDEINIFAGDDYLSVNCEDDYYKEFILKIFAVVKKAVTELNNNDVLSAKRTFREISNIFGQLNAWEQEADAALRYDSAQLIP